MFFAVLIISSIGLKNEKASRRLTIDMKFSWKWNKSDKWVLRFFAGFVGGSAIGTVIGDINIGLILGIILGTAWAKFSFK